MRVVNLNPDADIGASAWLLELDGRRLLMDAGMHPKRDGRAALPLYSRFDQQDVDAIALSHCHHDHVGSLPVALRHFRNAKVLMTDLSSFLIERVLHNSVNVMLHQREEAGINEYPLYTHEEIERNAEGFQGLKYNRQFHWAESRKTRRRAASPTLEFFDAGHALGAAGILVRGQSQTIFYTGDVCFHDQTILNGAKFSNVKAEVLIMETTRGNHPVPPGFTRQTEVQRLTQAIERVLADGGSILLPTFALGRTQEILALLALMMAGGKLRPRPIYIGGLGRVFTEIYDLRAHLTNRQHPDLRLTEALHLTVLEREELEQLKLGGGQIFVLTAGMMTEGTAAHDLAVRIMNDPRHAIFFVGYADPDTPGGRLKASKLDAPFFFSARAGEVTRRCEIQDFDLTAHADRDALIDFVGAVSPRVVLLGHGEAASRHWVEAQIRARHPKINVIQPAPGLSAGSFVLRRS
jgi:Cft2 family RNA processing exonuclease